MSWFRIDDQAAFGAKIVAAGNEAVGAWARAGAWSSGALSDGFVPRDVALTIAPKRVWDRLVAARAGHEHGLVEVREDGWQIHNFLRRNPSGEAVKAEREATRERVTNWRTKRSETPPKRTSNGVGNGVTTPLVTLLPIPSRSDPRSDPPVGPPTGGASATHGRKPRGERAKDRYAVAFEAGVRDGAPGVPWSPPRGGFGMPFVDALKAHAVDRAGPLRGEVLHAWIRSTAAEWRRTAEAPRPGFAHGWAPAVFVGWLNSGRPRAGSAGRQPERDPPRTFAPSAVDHLPEATPEQRRAEMQTALNRPPQETYDA